MGENYTRYPTNTRGRLVGGGANTCIRSVLFHCTLL